MLVNKRCTYCGKNFKAKTTKTKYCSHSCNAKHYKEKEREKRFNKLAEAGQSKFRSHHSILQEIQSREFLSIEKCAMMLDVSMSTIRRLIEDGDLASFNIKSRVIITREDVNHFCKSQIEKRKRKLKKPVSKVCNRAKHFNKFNYYFIGEITKYYNVSNKTVERHLKSKDVDKVKKGRFVYVLKSDVRKIFGTPTKTAQND